MHLCQSQKKKLNLTLLESYTKVETANVSEKNSKYPSTDAVSISDDFKLVLQTAFRTGKSEEYEWLAVASSSVTGDTVLRQDRNLKVSWTSHHVAKDRDKSDVIPAINAILPVIHYPSNTANFQAHFIRVTIDYTRFLNPNQRTAVGCSDQPLYALKKKLQWNHPELFPEADYFPIMGGLHIEMQLLKLNGQLIKGTGLEMIIEQACLSYIGLSAAISDVNDIKKARHTVQIAATCLYKKLKDAYLD